MTTLLELENNFLVSFSTYCIPSNFWHENQEYEPSMYTREENVFKIKSLLKWDTGRTGEFSEKMSASIRADKQWDVPGRKTFLNHSKFFSMCSESVKNIWVFWFFFWSKGGQSPSYFCNRILSSAASKAFIDGTIYLVVCFS